MFYVLCDVEGTDAFIVSDDDAVPMSFETEAEAVKVAKEYTCNSLIVHAVAEIVETTTHKYKKLK